MNIFWSEPLLSLTLALAKINNSCIAIASPSKKPFETWQMTGEDCQTTFMWLRDRLIKDLSKGVRVMIYGHNSHLGEFNSPQKLDDIAMILGRDLDLLTQVAKAPKPIVFIAHSLGGMILKSALNEMAELI